MLAWITGSESAHCVLMPGAVPPWRQDSALLLADQHKVWLFRSSALHCGALCQWEVLWKAGQVNPGSSGVWRLIRRTLGRGLDKTHGSMLSFCMIILPEGYHVSSAPFTSHGSKRAVTKPLGIWASQADSQCMLWTLETGLSQ